MPNNWHKKTKNAHWQNGSSRAYRVARAESLAAHERKGGGCELKIHDDCTNRAEEWHHTRDRRIYGDDPQYMQWACRPCNLKAGDPTRGDPAPTPRTEW